MLWKCYWCARIDNLYYKNICMKYCKYINILLQLKLELTGKHKCHFRSICLFFNFKKRNFFLRIVSFSSTYTVYRIFFAQCNFLLLHLQTFSTVLNLSNQRCIVREIIWQIKISSVLNSPIDNKGEMCENKTGKYFPIHSWFHGFNASAIIFSISLRKSNKSFNCFAGWNPFSQV